MSSENMKSNEMPKRRRVFSGIVVSNKMQKTIVVKVDQMIKHSSYKKYVMSSKKYKAHDETNMAKIGDLVEIIETKPISKEKVWALRAILENAKLPSDHQGGRDGEGELL